MKTMDKYTQLPGKRGKANGLYVVDNYEPYDLWFKPYSYYRESGPYQGDNNPQPLDWHLGNSYGARCYRSPHITFPQVAWQGDNLNGFQPGTAFDTSSNKPLSTVVQEVVTYDKDNNLVVSKKKTVPVTVFRSRNPRL